MKLSENGQLLRVFIGESDVRHGEPLYQAIVLKARELSLAGATVLRGPMGFGANSRMHTTTHGCTVSGDHPLEEVGSPGSLHFERVARWVAGQSA